MQSCEKEPHIRPLAPGSAFEVRTIGSVAGAGQVGSELLIKAIDWEPVVGDMFDIGGMHPFSPWMGIDTRVDVAFVVTGSPKKEGKLWRLPISPPILPDGPYRNVDRPTIDQAEIYRPAGEFLRLIREGYNARVS